MRLAVSRMQRFLFIPGGRWGGPYFTTCPAMPPQEMNNITSATEYYREVLKQDNTHVEAIACIGSNHFYTDQPEIALRFYRSYTLRMNY